MSNEQQLPETDADSRPMHESNVGYGQQAMPDHVYGYGAQPMHMENPVYPAGMANMAYPAYGAANMPMGLSGMHKQLVSTISDCACVCEHMISMLVTYSDVHRRTRQIQLLRDCAEICKCTTGFLCRGGEFSRAMAGLCAQICEACGRECSRFSDPASQHCSQVCLNCARECQRYAMGG